MQNIRTLGYELGDEVGCFLHNLGSYFRACDEEEVIQLLTTPCYGYEVFTYFAEDDSLVKKVRAAGYQGIVIPAIPERIARRDCSLAVSLLNAGADYYVVTPGAFQELGALMSAGVRRLHGHAQDIIHFNGGSINIRTGDVERDGEPVHVPDSENRILAHMATRIDHIVERESFEYMLYESRLREAPTSSILTTYICKLRGRIGPSAVKTIHRRGYKLLSPQAVAAE